MHTVPNPQSLLARDTIMDYGYCIASIGLSLITEDPEVYVANQFSQHVDANRLLSCHPSKKSDRKEGMKIFDSCIVSKRE